MYAAGVWFFEVPQSGEKMLTRQANNWSSETPPPPPRWRGPDAAGWRARRPKPRIGAVEHRQPGAEDRAARRVEAQMFREAWRVERDYFYDPGFTG